MIDTRVRLYDGPDDDIIEAINEINGEGYTQGDCIKRLLRELLITRQVMGLMAGSSSAPVTLPPHVSSESEDPFDIDFSEIEMELSV